ncbi:hypothetical protein F751_5179, partial [Auxenochlorella protothecoides]
IARVSTVAVVVPSPAASLVAPATCFTSAAPRLWKRSENSTALATVTPSLVILGPPYGCSITTFRPCWVTWTASASFSTPCSMEARQASPNRMSLAA